MISLELESLAHDGLLRRARALHPISPIEAVLDGRRVTLFSTNDYLGLSGHPAVIARAEEATARCGSGPRGAALVCAHTDMHERLEGELAELTQKEAALLFPTGYMANLGVLQSLGGADVDVFSDELNHASIVDGCRLSRSAVHVYRHGDIGHLGSLLRLSSAKRKIIVTEAVFSMDGDAAPLGEIVDLKEKHGALLIVDEAHSTLVYGSRGGGLAEQLGLSDAVDVLVGTLSKAFGAVGGFAAARAELRDYLVHTARSYIFTTALPVPVVAAALAALETARAEPAIRAGLWRNIAYFSTLLHSPRRFDSPIFPVVMGDANVATKAAAELLDLGLHVPAIRPPTVPPGTSRLRISVTALHTPEQLDRLAGTL